LAFGGRPLAKEPFRWPCGHNGLRT
jgi:hypothetical protein